MNRFARRHLPKKLSRAQKAVAPSMLEAVTRAEAEAIEDVEKRLRGDDG